MRFYGNGKLLLTGEYAVLDGAQALCLPTKLGQSLDVQKTEETGIFWKSFDCHQKIWFEDSFSVKENQVISTSNSKIAKRLLQILEKAQQLSKIDFSKQGFSITTQLDFEREWGLGTSSTLIATIAEWLQINPYKLLTETFGGSGYDIACASANGPILYEKTANSPTVLSTTFNPNFKEELFFVYLNKKQNSREGIAKYRNQHSTDIKNLILKTSNITQQLLQSEDLTSFEMLLDIHETIISQTIGLPKIKAAQFPDYPGSLKSLGAWGGDFILATRKNAVNYFQNKGYQTIIPYSNLIL